MTLRGHWRETFATLALIWWFAVALYLLLVAVVPWALSFLGWSAWTFGTSSFPA